MNNLPKDSENKIYIDDHDVENLQDLIDKCKEKWGENVSLSDLNITHEHIQVKCFGYDQYDSSDYIDFFVIEKLEKKAVWPTRKREVSIPSFFEIWND